MKMLRPFSLAPLVAALALALSMPAGAQNLIELHAAARGYDAAYQSAKSNLEAVQAKAAQARAALYPTAGLVVDSLLVRPAAAQGGHVSPTYVSAVAEKGPLAFSVLEETAKTASSSIANRAFARVPAAANTTGMRIGST